VIPGEKQYRLLRLLGNGCALVVGYRREIGPLLRHGWVTADDKGDHYAWVRITPTGLRALADAVEKYGLPDLLPEKEKAA